LDLDRIELGLEQCQKIWNEVNIVTKRCSEVVTEADILYMNRNNHPPPIKIKSSRPDYESHAEGISLSGWTHFIRLDVIWEMHSWGLDLPTTSYPDSTKNTKRCSEVVIEADILYINRNKSIGTGATLDRNVRHCRCCQSTT
jgi:hypothetical protein